MSRSVSSPRLLQWPVLVAVVGAAVVFLPPALDDFQVAKSTLVLVATVVTLALAVRLTVVRRTLVVPRLPMQLALGAFVVGLGLSVASSPVPGVSLFGVHGRSTGALQYVAYALLLVVAAWVFESAEAPRLVAAVLTAGAGVTLYGLAQLLDLTGAEGTQLYGDQVFSTLGNPNFASAYLGIVVPLVIWATLQRTWQSTARIATALGGVLLVVVLARTGSQQGLLAAAVGGTVLSAAWLLTREEQMRRRGLAALGAAVGVGGALGLLGLLGTGPLSRLRDLGTVELREAYWSAATGMVADNPLLGVGMDRYAAYYREYRPVEDVLRFGLGDANDQTHNVLLGMFANGGVLLGLAYAAVMGLVGVALVRGLLADVEQERRLLLGAVGGAWAGYVVVSLVSIDVPALATLGWVLSGGVLAVAGHTQFVRVPGRASPRGGLRPALDIGLVAVVLIATWGASLPLRADLAAGSATSLLANGRQAQGLEAAARATQLAPWRPVYWFELGRGLAVSGRFDQAQQAFQTAAAKDPRDLPAALTSARLAVRLGDADTARDEYERALALEPQHPALKVEVAEFASQVGAQEWARELLAEALAVDPDNEQARQLRDSLAS